ncbi:hypothetical protein [Bradyrhizobium elkanii]|uniref:hypothetical protein n=1 Tax=Bradyrhizobium elkanii TaxID=29448 RepID=UPI0012FE7529|nr:hypothetical protein [Bradyrhizobium elkanii]
MYTPTPRGIRQPKGLTEEKAARILSGLKEGQTLRLFWVRPDRFKDYCNKHPEYACEALPLVEANAIAAQRRKGAFLGSMTHCKKGHSLADARVSTRSNGYTMRACRTCQAIRAKEAKPLPAAQLIAVKAALSKGHSIADITGAHPGIAKRLNIVNPARFYNARKFDPEFDRFVLASIRGANSIGKSQKLRWSRQKAQATSAQRREEANDYYNILAMLPANFPDKDDVVSRIFESILDGSLRREDVRARVKFYIAEHNRMFPTKFAKFGDSPLLSLDEVMFEDGAATRGDSVSRGLWD